MFEHLQLPAIRQISTAELSLLFEGAQFTVHSRAKPWRRPQPASAPAPDA
jgi:hypothetical protein